MDATRPVITLTTDFGLSDPYVAAMKGVILTLNPGAVIVDVTHDIRPQSIEQAVFVLDAALPYFPKNAVHVVVVDPGVGTERRPLALATPAGCFVGPDNGVLAAALPEDQRKAGETRLPDGYRAVVIEPRRVAGHEISSTFHGRDIFAPAAARLTLGIPVESLGKRTATVASVPPFRAKRDEDGVFRGRVVHVDRFGNLVTDVRGADLAGGHVTVEIEGRKIDGLSTTYGVEKGKLVALVGSGGYLEIAVAQGSAAELLGADIGSPTLVYDGAISG